MRGKLAGFLILVVLGSLVVLLVPTIPTYAVEQVILTPNHGAVGTRVNVTAWIDRPGGRYYIFFATGANGAGLGMIKSGVAPAGSTLVNDYFIVPACFGSTMGYPHTVQVQDESVYGRNADLSVESSISMSVPASARVGDRVPINITISGGYPSTSYSFDVGFVDGRTGQTLVRLSTQRSSDSRGSLSYMLYYPDSFVPTSQIGNYTIRTGIISSSPFMEDPGTNTTLTRSFQILQSPNQPPIAQILSIAPNPAFAGQQVTFTGNGSDTDGFIVGYNWTSSIDKSLSTSRTFSRSNLTEGNHTIYLRVQDNNGTWSNQVSTSLVVRRANQIPNATIDSILPNPARLGQQVTFFGHGDDADGSITGYQWTSDINGTLSFSSAFSASNLKVGNHNISFQVRDNNMTWSVPKTQILVVEPKIEGGVPIAYIDSIRPNSVYQGEQVTFIGHGSDSDGVVVGYRWTSNIDGWLGDSSNFSTSSLSVGDHTISFEVQDNNGSWSVPFSASLKVELEKLPPNAVIDSALPSSIAVGQQLNFSGHGDDPTGVIVGYRWVSNIDGLLSTSAEFSTSGLSKGSHRITFQVQNGEGVWSDEVVVMVDVVEPTSLFWLLPVVGGLAGATGAFSFVHFSRPPSSTEVKKDLHEKEEKEKKKRKKEKQKSSLSIETDFPSRIMGAMSNEATVKVRNVGLNEVKDVVVSVDATDGLLLEEKSKPMFSMQPNGERSLVFRFKTSENLKKGVYTLRFVVRSRDTPKQARNYYSRAVKIGLLSNAGKQEYAEPLRRWLREKSYMCDELQSADNLVKSLLKYDLVILAPEMELPKQWMRNLFSFVENSQSLLVTDKVITSEEKLLADILGYGEMQYQELKSDERLLVVSSDQLIIPRELAGGEKIRVEKLWGNACVSKLSTGKNLTEICRENEENTPMIPALVINEFMEGKTAHLNFHAEGSLPQISSVLEKTLDWLLSEDVSVQPKPWSSGLLSLKLARATLSELLRRSPSHAHQPS